MGKGVLEIWKSSQRNKESHQRLDDKNKEEGRNLTGVKHTTHALNALNRQIYSGN